MANPQAVAAVVPFPVPAPDAVSPPGNGKFGKALCQGDKSLIVKVELEETSDGDAAKGKDREQTRRDKLAKRTGDDKEIRPSSLVA